MKKVAAKEGEQENTPEPTASGGGAAEVKTDASVVAQSLDCRVTFQLITFRARRCIQNAACSQAAFSLLPRYKKHSTGTAPPPQSWFQGHFPAARRANGQGQGPTDPIAKSIFALRRRRCRQGLMRQCASFAPTHDLVFSAIPTGLRFPVSIRVSNYVSCCSQPALTLSFSRFVHLLG